MNFGWDNGFRNRLFAVFSSLSGDGTFVQTMTASFLILSNSSFDAI